MSRKCLTQLTELAIFGGSVSCVRDFSEPVDHMIHAPTCLRPGVALERGFSVIVTRCLGCHAVTTVRHTTTTTPKGTT